MNDSQETVLRNLAAWSETLDVLVQNLTAGDEDASHESVFILLLQGFGLFGGPEGTMMHLFPVLDSMKTRIDKSDVDGALRQAIIFRQQLDEVRALVCSGTASVEQGAHSAQRNLFEAEEKP